MDVNRIVGKAKRQLLGLMPLVKWKDLASIAKSFGLSFVLLGTCFIVYFCIAGYPDQDDLDDFRTLPAIIQFLLTSPVYIGMYFTLLGSVLLVGGLILSAVDKVYRQMTQRIADINCELSSVKSIISASRIKADDKQQTSGERAAGQGVLDGGLPKPDNHEMSAPVVKSKYIRIWPFTS